MNRSIKSLLRDLLPKKYQVPAKYWYRSLRGGLEKELDILFLIVQKQSRTIDIGGNRGTYAYCLWRLRAKLEVFEPNPKCNSILSAWSSGKPDVNIHPVALSDSSGQANLHIPIDESGEEHDASASIEHAEFDNARDELVSLKTLDSYHFDNVSFIKIDVEGHEHKVIQGAAATISTSHPALLVEIEQRHHSRSINEIFDKIIELGYQGFYLDGEELMALKNFDVECHQSKNNFDDRKERYLNNFLFLHQDRLKNGEYTELMKRSSPA